MAEQSAPVSSAAAVEATQLHNDAALVDFLSSLNDYTPTIPDELAEQYLSRSGFQCPDTRVTRLVSIATQKFVGEIASDALQYCKIRQTQIAKDKKGHVQAKEKRLVLTTEDLSLALREVWNSTYFKCFFGSTINTVVAEYTYKSDG
ncbi:hypothetical protein KC19_VG122500 [Ceratodon purpureus]|uniref:Transcription initiation factor TFIID subunit 10 n=1 Tax=Ceratodon purpureus TaxID=3225 RepID=A0A8T0HQA7_CERPU|nr:hypothetical protein KC19_VG122500 [Ceratodon purpureus]